ncbi:MDR family NADP-dependent oxidoreductase [Actinoplanes awajinensis]|uniref:Enoyl reductase (ER) domain-containing protein n=1 Tax=Actinoplanes awajinensis subsp. mycoplanecinus TaxID=135947 RepID=A0A0X3VB89_9ACTN|nr:NADP-dependent oxidoreductase [Actinoplanes awajinensis]KUL41522.1 hypothetical protein ADL15_04550 [Actinoplanes awajinensis subsp. mycoplanecinus]
MTVSREIHLIARPPGRLPVPGTLAVVEVELPDVPEPGEVVVRNTYQAVDPGLLQRMQDIDGPGEPDFALGGPPWGHALGEVVASASPDLNPGDTVLHNLAWREYAVAPADKFRAVPLDRFPSVTHHLSSAVVAWVGLSLVEIHPGDTVLVSSGVGAVGSVAGQLARVRGAGYVIASTGSPAKAKLATEQLGYDRAFDYHDGWPDDLPGVDVYYDNAGGRQLESAITVMNTHGRIVKCGGTDQIRTGEPYGIRNIEQFVHRRLSMHGMATMDHEDLFAEFDREFPPLVADGRVVLPETIVEGGLDRLVPAAEALLTGAYSGKVLLKF